jgi:bifunctional ADP-heptose synthase (sugar kinase/adenylyltransferase)
MGDGGLMIFKNNETYYLPAILVNGKIDIVGAGDSVISGLTSSLAVGASLEEAVMVGSLMASITIQQLGTTGVATPSQICDRLNNLDKFDLSTPV